MSELDSRPIPDSVIHRAIQITCAEHGLNIDQSSFEVLGRGRLNRVFVAKDQNASLRYVIRVRHFEHIEYGQKFAAERLLQGITSLSSVGVPRVYFVDESRRHLDARFAVLEHVSGVAAETSLSISQLERLGLLLAKLHGVKLDEVKGVMREDVEKLRFGLANDLRWIAQFDQKLANNVTGASECWPWHEFDSDLVVTHGDVHSRNVLFSPETGQVRLIDWEAAKLRHPVYDFVKLRLFGAIDESGEAVMLRSYRNAGGRSFVPNALSMRCILWHARMIRFESQFPSKDPDFPTIHQHLSSIAKRMKEFS